MPRRAYIDISKKPTMPVKCASCPFGPNGDIAVAAGVTSRIIVDGSQLCHSTGTGHKATHLCRGARDVQLKVFHAIGVIAAPTDEAWDQTRKEQGV